MRNGQILASGSPQAMTKRLACNDLDTVFVKLCQKHDESERHEKLLQGVENALTCVFATFFEILTQPFINLLTRFHLTKKNITLVSRILNCAHQIHEKIQ